MNCKFKDGFTLMELMVYIALLGGIVLIAGQAFNDSTKMRIRTQSMLQSNQDVGNIGSIIKADIAQIGAKSSMEGSGVSLDVFDVSHIHNVYMDPDNATDDSKDSSSFTITKNDGGNDLDKITMRRLRYTDAGKYDGVEEVSWFVEDKILKRSCTSIEALTNNEDCPTDNTTIVSIAEGVNKFVITPAKPCTTSTSVNVLPSTSETEHSFKLVSRFGDENFEALNIAPETGVTSNTSYIRLSGFTQNYDFTSNAPITNPDLIKVNQVFLAPTGSDETSWSSQCTQITLVPFVEYEISFSMPNNAEEDPSRMFCPGRDHMAVGFRNAENGKKPDGLHDFQFYPPTSIQDNPYNLTPPDTGLRTMRFTTRDTIKNVCLGFTFAFFSPVASSGNINIKNVKLKMIPSSNYSFVNGYEPPIIDKKNVKALKVELVINKNGESGTETAFIPIPSNGPRD